MEKKEENYISCTELRKFIMEHPNFKPNGDFKEVVSDLLLMCNVSIAKCFATKSKVKIIKVVKHGKTNDN